MSHVRCVVQEAGNADTRRTELERRLLANHAEHYPGEAPVFAWIPIPHGHMFTEGEQSTSSIVSFFLDHATTLAQRERYMRGACDIWTDVTDCTDHEVVVTVTEPDTANQE